MCPHTTTYVFLHVCPQYLVDSGGDPRGLILKYMCTHTTPGPILKYVSSYYFTRVLILLHTKRAYTSIYPASAYYIASGLILLYMCPHTTTYVLILIYLCPHATAYVSSCWYICVLILLHMCPHPTTCILILLPVSSCYMCVLILLYVSSTHVSSHHITICLRLYVSTY